MFYEVMKNIVNIEKNLVNKNLYSKLTSSKIIEIKSYKNIILESEEEFIKNEWPWLI